MNDRITLVAMAGLDKGSNTRQMMRASDKPSIRAASISDLGTASNAALNTKMHTIVDNMGKARPK